ncbi:hypothetical protein [Cyanobacterium stanieri]|nr:hypothetical protein [Cyanobacterium stanieri]
MLKSWERFLTDTSTTLSTSVTIDKKSKIQPFLLTVRGIGGRAYRISFTP